MPAEQTAAGRTDVGDRLYHADLVVDGHDGDERRVGANRGLQNLNTTFTFTDQPKGQKLKRDLSRVRASNKLLHNLSITSL